jgi:hypothetical protein
MSNRYKELLKKSKRPTPVASTTNLFDNNESKPHQSLKNRIRSLKRLLQKGTLPKQAVKDKKRLLLRLEKQLVDNQFDKKEHRVGARYHRVKFFERQKITRRLKKIHRVLQTLEGESHSPLEKDLEALGLSESVKIDEVKNSFRKAQLDLIYIRWYPRHLKYISLFSSSESSTKDKETLRSKMDAARRWAFHNALQGDFLRTAPSVDLTEEEKDLMISKRVSGGIFVKGVSAAIARSSNDQDGEIEYDDISGEDQDEDDDDGGSDDSSEEEEEHGIDVDVDTSSKEEGVQDDRRQRKLTSVVVRATAPAPRAALPAPGKKRRRGSTEEDAEAPAAPSPPRPRVRAGSDDEAANVEEHELEFVKDPFFSRPVILPASVDGAVAAPVFPVFRDVLEADSAPRVRGPQTSAARYERHRGDTGRYRDSATFRAPASAFGAKEGPREQPLAKNDDGIDSTAASLSHLSGRKLKRALRAQSYTAAKASDSTGLTSGKYGESNFGTEADPGAKLRHEYKKGFGMAAKEFKEARRGQFDRRPPGYAPGNASRSTGSAGKRFGNDSRPQAPDTSSLGSHFKFV